MGWVLADRRGAGNKHAGNARCGPEPCDRLQQAPVPKPARHKRAAIDRSAKSRKKNCFQPGQDREVTAAILTLLPSRLAERLWLLSYPRACMSLGRSATAAQYRGIKPDFACFGLSPLKENQRWQTPCSKALRINSLSPPAGAPSNGCLP